ncbi:NADH:flavin oxidoreductase/NADH oxidase family protein [Vibrio splendidus]|uniref:NADH:flavin oxidoreductase/NADH oxidase family protein n=1 Tax=Vibrio splendidus TaxID=29497 RepID=UPI001C072917|nr:NADH:flavin oxidoreductase/NADH oxidase family protein [Vibrio splendidus]MBU2909693.1 NADH:flavin oxidoreductase/NADH oxidase family protein [Vibrio splendidus]MDO6532062.1 NADH:flavin oxidoreductase/NADH oxidase family protein [Vibrio splendidus]MDO6553582.1 NADH:flavin oxidoreductase/NADH oxidase family protein [Vibrio splendidus]
MNPICLNDPFSLPNSQVIKNRLFKSAMSEQLGDKHHNPKQGLVTLYQRWAQGGIGLSMTGNVMVDRGALGEPKNVVLDEHSDLTVFREWASAGTQNGSQIWMQLNHPGKQIPKFLCDSPVAPSAISLERGLEKGFNTPRALTEAEIIAIIDKFALSAKLSKQAGFTGVQIHGAHGYLVSQFLSSRHNQRQDKWGGSLENRLRFVLEVYRAIRKEVGDDFPVGIKLNSADFMKGGFTEEESMQVVQTLSDNGIDLIEISGGTYESPSMMGSKSKTEPIKASTVKREAYFMDYMVKARKLVSTPLVVTGGFRTAQAMNEALNTSATDFIGIARTMAVDPDFPNKLIEDPSHGMPLTVPTTGKPALDKMAMVGLVWYEHQMWRIASGKNADPKLSALSVVVKTILSAGWHAFKKLRA